MTVQVEVFVKDASSPSMAAFEVAPRAGERVQVPETNPPLFLVVTEAWHNFLPDRMQYAIRIQ